MQDFLKKHKWMKKKGRACFIDSFRKTSLFNQFLEKRIIENLSDYPELIYFDKQLKAYHDKKLKFVGIENEVKAGQQKSLKTVMPYSKDITDKDKYVIYVKDDVYDDDEQVRWRKLDHQLLITQDQIIETVTKKRKKRRNNLLKKRGSGQITEPIRHSVQSLKPIHHQR